MLSVNLVVHPSRAGKLKSLNSTKPCTLTIYNATTYTIDVLWLNYDGDPELYATLDAGTAWIVDTFTTHPFRFSRSDTGAVLQEYVATSASQQLVQVQDVAVLPAAAEGAPGATDSTAEGSPGQLSPPVASATSSSDNNEGFDGLGNTEADYVLAKLSTVTVLPTVDASVVTLSLVGYDKPLNLLLGLAEARLLVNASGTFRGRRPSTMATWRATLQAASTQVERIVVTRLVNEVFYARIVLRLADGSMATVDCRPSDALCLSAVTSAQVFVAKAVADIAQQQPEAADPLSLLVPPQGGGLQDPLMSLEAAPSA